MPLSRLLVRTSRGPKPLVTKDSAAGDTTICVAHPSRRVLAGALRNLGQEDLCLFVLRLLL